MQRVLKIGHRGAAGHAPENTLGAIQTGIALGVDFVEIDVRRTADGVLVILHDETVNRTTNGKGQIDRVSLQEAKQLNAGNGEPIPTLEEAINVLAGRAGLLLELKVNGVAQQAVETVRRAGLTAPVIYASFLHEELTQVHIFDPNTPLMLLFGRLPRNPVAMDSHPWGITYRTSTRQSQPQPRRGLPSCRPACVCLHGGQSA